MSWPIKSDKAAGTLRIERPHGGWFLTRQRAQHGEQIAPPERGSAGRHPIQDTSQAEQIGPRIDGISGDLLRGHVSGRADHHSGVADFRLGRPRLCQAEVEDLDSSRRRLFLRQAIGIDGLRHRGHRTVVSRSRLHWVRRLGPFQPDVGRLDIAMQQASCMGRRQPLGDLAADPDDFRNAQSTGAGKMVLEGFAVEQLQDKERRLVCANPT